MLRRFLNGRSPLRPDRGHLHHVISRMSLNAQLSSVFLCSLALFFGFMGFIGHYYRVDQWVSFSAFIVFLMGYVVFVTLSNKNYPE